MGNTFLVGVAVAAAVLGAVALSRRSPVPAPVFLVLAGVGLSFVPHLPRVILRPDVVFYVFLPPLLYSAAFFSSPRELRRNWVPISLLAVGLVLATLFAVAGAAGGILGLDWGAAFALGAIVAPTDPISATAVLARLGAPQRLRTILEGESLVNDGVALVVYRLAVAAAVGAGFSAAHGVARFAEMAAGGVAIGAVLGFLVVQVRQRLHDTELETVISLVMPFVAYVPAERAHVSGVLAVVSMGVFLGWRSEGIFLPETRLQATAFWSILTFLLGSVLFVLLGAQLRVVVAGIHGVGASTLVWYALVVVVAVIAIRLLFQAAAPASSWRARLVLGWSGMRGAITLAAALALPVRFPARDLVLYLAFAVVLATLVLQGISLPLLVRRLGLGRGEEAGRREREARIALLEAALARADELDGGVADPVRDLYAQRLRRLAAGEEAQEELSGLRAAQRELIAAQRRELRRLRREGGIDVETARRLQRELDVEELRIGR